MTEEIKLENARDPIDPEYVEEIEESIDESKKTLEKSAEMLEKAGEETQEFWNMNVEIGDTEYSDKYRDPESFFQNTSPGWPYRVEELGPEAGYLAIMGGDQDLEIGRAEINLESMAGPECYLTLRATLGSDNSVERYFQIKGNPKTDIEELNNEIRAIEDFVEEKMDENYSIDRMTESYKTT